MSSLLAVVAVLSCFSCKKANPIDVYNQENYRVAHAWRLCNEKYANEMVNKRFDKLGQWAEESKQFEPRMRAIRPPKGWEQYHQTFIDVMHHESEGLNAAYRYISSSQYGKAGDALVTMGDNVARDEQRLVEETQKLGYRVDSLQTQASKSKALWLGIKKGLKP